MHQPLWHPRTNVDASPTQRSLPTKAKRKVHAMAGEFGVWSLSIRREVTVDGVSVEEPTVNPRDTEDTIIISSHKTPAVSRVRFMIELTRF